MIRSIRAAIALVFLSAACSAPTVGGALSGGAKDVATWRKALSSTRGSVLKVVNSTCDGIATGSGFVLDSHTLVTNDHVVAGAQTLSVLTQQGAALNVRVADASGIDDIAVVHTVQTLPPPIPLAARDPVAGDLVRTLGYPLGGPFKPSDGRVIDLVDGAQYEHRSPIIQTTAEVRPGNSGGPLVDAYGRVSGVVFAVDTSNGDALAIPVSRLRAVLRDARAFGPVVAPCATS